MMVMEQEDAKIILDELKHIDDAVVLADNMDNSMLIRSMAIKAIKVVTNKIRIRVKKLSSDLYPELP